MRSAQGNIQHVAMHCTLIDRVALHCILFYYFIGLYCIQWNYAALYCVTTVRIEIEIRDNM